MSAPPYMRMYWGDYARDTGHLNRSEHGAYLLLLKAMWTSGGKLPSDDRKLARLALCTEEEWAEIREIIMPFFKRRGGVIRHKRVDLEWAKCNNTSRQASEAGQASASKKANRNNEQASTDVQRTFNGRSTISDIRYSSEANASAEAGFKPDPDALAWQMASAVLSERGGVDEAGARKFFGRVLSTNGLEARDMLPAVSAATVNGTQDPKSYLTKAAQQIAKRRTGAEAKRVAFV